jgi:hypothetical protein
MGLDELELELRRLRGVRAVGFQEDDGLLLVELQAGPDSYAELARDATLVANQGTAGPVAVEVVRWGDRGEPNRDTRLRLVEITTDAAAGELHVCLALGDRQGTGRASTAHGLLAPVEATVAAVRAFLPELRFVAGWARHVETTPERRFLVVASVTDPDTQEHRRGAAEGTSPIAAATRATLAALNRTIAPDLAPLL